MMHHCYIGLPQRRIPLCHNGGTQCFFGAICGMGPITTLTRRSSGTPQKRGAPQLYVREFAEKVYNIKHEQHLYFRHS
jgi:hypothetical protein